MRIPTAPTQATDGTDGTGRAQDAQSRVQALVEYASVLHDVAARTPATALTELPPPPTGLNPDELAVVMDAADALGLYDSAALSANTLKAYRTGIRGFKRWSEERRVSWLPAHPLVVASYLAERVQDHAVATVRMDAQAIRAVHVSKGLPSPTSAPIVRSVLAGIRRVEGRPQKQAAAITLADLTAAYGQWDPKEHHSMRDIRDRALILVGFGLALRRSEIARLRVNDVVFRPEGAEVLIRRSKTDKAGQGVVLPLHAAPASPLCPVDALRTWIREIRAYHEGRRTSPADVSPRVRGGWWEPTDEDYLFTGIGRWGHIRRPPLTGHSINTIVHTTVSPYCALPVAITAHSLRAGYITEAARRGMPTHLIQQHSRHRSVAVLNGYIRKANLFENAGVGSIFSTTPHTKA